MSDAPTDWASVRAAERTEALIALRRLVKEACGWRPNIRVDETEWGLVVEITPDAEPGQPEALAELLNHLSLDLLRELLDDADRREQVDSSLSAKCSFCENARSETRIVIVGPNAAVCADCIGLLHDIVTVDPPEAKAEALLRRLLGALPGSAADAEARYEARKLLGIGP